MITVDVEKADGTSFQVQMDAAPRVGDRLILTTLGGAQTSLTVSRVDFELAQMGAYYNVSSVKVATS